MAMLAMLKQCFLHLLLLVMGYQVKSWGSRYLSGILFQVGAVGLQWVQELCISV